jgi:hypothetical protein
LNKFWWIVIIFIINVINLLHNMIVSNYKMNQIDDVFKNEMSNEIEKLFNGNESKLIEAIVALNLGLNLIKKKKYKVKK